MRSSDQLLALSTGNNTDTPQKDIILTSTAILPTISNDLMNRADAFISSPLSFMPPPFVCSSTVQLPCVARSQTPVSRSSSPVVYTVIPMPRAPSSSSKPPKTSNVTLRIYPENPVSARRTFSSNYMEDSFAHASLGDSSVFVRSTTEWKDPSVQRYMKSPTPFARYDLCIKLISYIRHKIVY